MVSTTELLAAADALDTAADASGVQQERQAIRAVLAHKEAIQIGLMQARMRRCAETPHVHERLPLRDEGDDIGYVQARIPKDLLFHLGMQDNFGWDGIFSDEGMRDILKAYPVCKVKTVSGKTTVGWRSSKPEAPSSKLSRPGRGRWSL